jgi:ferredoxin
MTETTTVLLCSCEDSMQLDPASVAKGTDGARIIACRHLCRSEIDRYRSAAKSGRLVVTCTQEAPLFEEVAEDEGLAAAVSFVNVREAAGWSSEGARAAPKMAALIAGAQVADPPAPAVTIESQGVTLIYGRGQSALDAAERLKDHLDITVLLADASDAVPPRRAEYPVRKGRIATVKGRLGAFEIAIDGFAEPLVSSRKGFVFGPGRQGAVSKADILIDLTGDKPLVTAPELRDGYLRADPARPADVDRVVAKAGDLVGTFDKPRYVGFRSELCAHSRSRITGCTRCLDLCPAGAITPHGNHVAIDPYICGGCGQCAAACPTGAAAYAVPPVDRLIERLRRILIAYAAAGGQKPALLVHDEAHGAPLIDALARFGAGLPANVIPIAVNEVTEVGIETIAAALAYGVTGLRFLTRARPRHPLTGLELTVANAGTIAAALGYGAGVVGIIAADDPDALAAALVDVSSGTASPRPSRFKALGGKRDVLKLALREAHKAAPAPVPVVALAKGAPFGRVTIRTEGCTLCLSCVAACPTSALGDAADRPMLTFDESLCVQCGLCAGTCPEKVMSLEPRLDFAAFEAGKVTVKEEEPFCCTRCAKPFGTRSAIERVIAKLEGKHWMFAGEGKSRLDMLKLCEDCRVIAATEASIDPYGAPPRPAPRTTEDYLRERAAREAEMLKKIDTGEA